MTATRYGWFRDEFYYVACGEHLAFGYVDHPPLVALIARVVRSLGGDSPFPLRAVAAVAGWGTVTLTGRMAWQLGARWFGVALASVCALAAPLLLSIDGFFSMNTFDFFLWAVAASIVVAILVDESTTKRWVWLGVVIGIGLENKLSIGFFSAGLALGLVASPARALLRTRGPWLCVALAIGLWLPNLIWQATNGWITVEFMNQARTTKNAALPPLTFLAEQVQQMHPITAPVWITAVFALLVGRLRAVRPLGVVYLFVLVLFMTSRGKAYYVGPAYSFLLAAGAVTIERFVQARWARAVSLAVVPLAGSVTAPLVVPVLGVDTLIRYQRFLGFAPGNAERGERPVLAQRFSDQLGWDSLVEAVARARDQLPADERADIGIFAGNYGEAGAVDVLGGRYGLPRAMSGHNNYWLWGPKGRPSGPFLIIDTDDTDLRKVCGVVTPLAQRTEPLAMPEERNLTVFLCRDPVSPLPALWGKVRHFN